LKKSNKMDKLIVFDNDSVDNLELQMRLKLKLNEHHNKLLIEQFVPRFEDFTIHLDIAQKFKNLYRDNYLPFNILLYGLSGSGKYSLIMAFLQHMYGDIVFFQKEQSIKLGNKEFLITTNQHYFMVDVKSFKKSQKILVIEFIKYISKKLSIIGPYNIIVIKNIDSLNKEHQVMMIRQIEKRFETLRILATCTSTNNIINSLFSRLLSIRIPLPKENEVFNILETLARMNKYRLDINKMKKIVTLSECNLWKAINILQLSYNKNTKSYNKFKDILRTSVSQLLTYSTSCSDVNYQQIRNLIYKLTILGYSASDILKTATNIILKKCSNNIVKYKAIDLAAKYDWMSKKSDRELYHIEAFFLEMVDIFQNHKPNGNS